MIVAILRNKDSLPDWLPVRQVEGETAMMENTYLMNDLRSIGKGKKEVPVDLDAYDEATLRLKLAKGIADYLGGSEREPTGGSTAPKVIADVVDAIGMLIEDADKLLSMSGKAQDKQ